MRTWTWNRSSRRRFSDFTLARATIIHQYVRLLADELGGIEEIKSKKSFMANVRADTMPMIWHRVSPAESLTTKCFRTSSSRAAATSFGLSGAKRSTTIFFDESRKTRIGSVKMTKWLASPNNLPAKASKNKCKTIQSIRLNCRTRL